MPFSSLRDSEFVGRSRELADLERRALDTAHGRSPCLFLAGPRGAGKTELLKQLFRRLFWKQDGVVPFFYAVNGALLSAADFSRDYLSRFVCQWLAFEHKEQGLLSLEGLPLTDLMRRAQERGAGWAVDLLDRFRHALDEPVDALRAALGGPRQSALAAGKPVVALIDDFHRLQGLSRNGRPDPHLVSLFEVALSPGMTTAVITGNAAEIRELPLPRLEPVPLRPLTHDDGARLMLAVLRDRGLSAGAVPRGLLDALGGIPLYLGATAAAVEANGALRDEDFWKAYLREIDGGSIAVYWSSALKSAVRDLAGREEALTTARRICSTETPLPRRQPSGAPPLTAQPAEGIMDALCRAGLVRGEFGVFRPPEDRVLRDAIECLYQREILGATAREIETLFRERRRGERRDAVAFELVLPMVREAELVAAQCIEQIGKSRHVGEDAVGQLQMAVIEACINAIEHGRGGERKIYVGIQADAERLEVSIESPGREFVPAETGEPLTGKAPADEAHRGWGVKLMKRFADEVRFERTGRGTRVVLVKNLPRPSEISKEDVPNRE